MKRGRYGRRTPRKERRRLENERRIAELTRFARQWCEDHPPKLDPRVAEPERDTLHAPDGVNFKVLYDLSVPEPRPFQPVVEIPVHPRRVLSPIAGGNAFVPSGQRFRMRAVEWRLDQENTRVRWHTWEPVRPLPDDAQKVEQVRAARDVVSLVGVAISELRYVFGFQGMSHSVEVLERLALAARVWLGELPAVRDKPTEEDVRKMYEWWAYGNGRGHGQEKWR